MEFKQVIEKRNSKLSQSQLSSTKEKVKSLPLNFFEKVLDLELLLKREFSMSTLQEIVNLYSLAIEYYESIEDKKYKDYQNRLNILLSQPDILKKMNEFYLNKDMTNSRLDTKTRLLKEQEKKEIKMKVSQISNFSDNVDKVAKILQTLSQQDEKEDKTVDTVMIEEIEKQKNNFKHRLDEKRKRQSYIVNNSNLEKIVMSYPLKNEKSQFGNGVISYNLNFLLTEGVNGGTYHENGEEVHNENDKNLESFRTRKTEKTDKSSQKSSDKIDLNNVETYLESSFDKYEKEKINEIEEMFSPFRIIENGASNGGTSNFTFAERSKSIRDVSTTMFRINENLLDSKHIGPKHRQIFLEIRDTLDTFVNEFNVYFYEHVFQTFTDHIHKLMDEKYLKYVEISKNYHSQIKEMEFLVTGDCEDQHRDGIKAIIESLKEEQEHELDRIQDHYNKLIAESQANFKNFGFKSNPGIQLIEEKFKLDMYNLINMILLPRK